MSAPRQIVTLALCALAGFACSKTKRGEGAGPEPLTVAAPAPAQLDAGTVDLKAPGDTLLEWSRKPAVPDPGALGPLSVVIPPAPGESLSLSLDPGEIVLVRPDSLVQHFRSRPGGEDNLAKLGAALSASDATSWHDLPIVVTADPAAPARLTALLDELKQLGFTRVTVASP